MKDLLLYASLDARAQIEPVTFREIGAVLGMHAERVRQLEASALQKLRKLAAKSRWGPAAIAGSALPQPRGPKAASMSPAAVKQRLYRERKRLIRAS